jgi:lambda family phage portal protein
MSKSATASLNGHARPSGLFGPDDRPIGGTTFNPRNTGYSHYGANVTKNSMVGWIATGGSPDEDITDNAQLLRERSRDAKMGICLACGAVETLVTNVIGYGIYPSPNPDGEYLGLNEAQLAMYRDRLAKYFDSWADSPGADYNDRFSFYSLQALAFESMLLSGDCPVLLPVDPREQYQFDLRVRVLEADRVMNPPEKTATTDAELLYGGVELDTSGRVIAYWINQRHPLSRHHNRKRGAVEQFVRVPVYGAQSGRRNILFLMRPERPEQRRGVPFLSIVLETLKQQGRYIDATTVKAVITSYFTAFIRSEMPSSDMLDNLLTPDQKRDIWNFSPYNVQLGPGQINFLKPGDSVDFSTNTASDPNFDGFVLALTKQIGSALCIPYEILLKQFNASYSASRAAFLEFGKRIKMYRQLVVDQFCQPIYEEWLAEAVATEVIDAPRFFEYSRVRRAWSRCVWTGVSQGSIDPTKEIDAAMKKIQAGVSTVEREAIEINGSDWHDNVTQQGVERAAFDENDLIYPTLRGLPNIPVRGVTPAP